MEHAAHTADLVATVVGLLLIAAATLAFTKRIKLPFTVALVLVGMGLTQLAEHGPEMLRPLTEYEVSPGVILYVFLPTLIFESAFNLDARQLRHNLLPILTLAVPGLVLSTALIGVLVWLVTPIDLPAALLLGSILSATDPVAVIALFKQLGAPKRLTILVEGESLFNDATAIVAAKILIGVVAAGYFTADTALSGVADFFQVFLGGVVVGVVLAVAAGWVLGWVESDPHIEISLTTILAYASFLIAEEAFHVSGVMATVAAGLTIGGWGRAKISPSVSGYLNHFWEYMAFVANALIFLLVGLRADLSALAHSLDLLPWVILAMLISRAVVIYSLVPLAGRFSAPVKPEYQTVMYWGGLRGAIALAIALSLEGFAYAETFVALVMGAVLFTLLVQGLSIEALVKRLGLDKPPLADRLALLERDLSAHEHTLDQLPVLIEGGHFSSAIAERMRRECEEASKRIKRQVAELREQELGHHEELMLLYLRAFSEEQAFYLRMYHNGHLSEGAYRELMAVLALQIDAIRYQGQFEHVHSHRMRRLMERGLYRLIDRLGWAWLVGLAEHMRAERIIRNYEEVLGHFRGSGWVLERLDRMAEREGIPDEVIEEVRGHYQRWHGLARNQLDMVAGQFPEMVTAMQERLSRRVMLLAAREATEEQVTHGLLPGGVGEALNAEIARRLNALRGLEAAPLKVDPEELLRKVPFFSTLPESESAAIAALLKPRTAVENDLIVEQDDAGDSLYLIGRGVVRVLRRDEGGEEKELATLLAGDFFGEMALLRQAPRAASCRAVTPCALYELKRADFDKALDACPAIGAALRQADEERGRALNNGDSREEGI